MTGRKAGGVCHQISLSGRGPEEVRHIGVAIGRRITAGVNIALHGELGAGKTYLVKAMCEGLDVRDPVTSPTYAIVNSYSGRFPVFHVDLYRINESAELDAIGIDDMIRGDSVCFFEWPDIVSGRLGSPRMDIALEWAGFSDRNLIFSFSADAVWKDIHTALAGLGDRG